MAKVVNVPNALTVLRMIMVFFMPGLLLGGHELAALIVFLAAGATDLLDGYIARKYNLITNFGKLMDPLADKLMVTVTLILFAMKGWTPWAVPVLVVVKELIMVVGGIFLLRKKTVVYAKVWGKVATFLFTVAIVLTFLHRWTAPFDLVLMWIAVAVSVFAMVQYAITFAFGGKNQP